MTWVPKNGALRLWALDPTSSIVSVFDTALVCEPPGVYCTPKTSSAGCVAAITTSDPFAQPTSAAADYAVTAANVQGLKNGILFATPNGPVAVPFHGGTLCVQAPLKRGPIQSSGSSDPAGCLGALFTVVNDGTVLPIGLDAGPGNSAWYQYWYRDRANGAGPLGTALSKRGFGWTSSRSPSRASAPTLRSRR